MFSPQQLFPFSTGMVKLALTCCLYVYLNYKIYEMITRVLLFVSFVLGMAGAGEAQTLKKYAVSNSGCSVYMFCDPGRFDIDHSEDSSTVYTAQCETGDVTYGVICIRLLEQVNDLKEAEELMISYLDYLKLDFEIKSAAGYGKGHKLNNAANSTGVIDYWKDAANNNWKIKAWTDGKYIGVLFAFSKKELPEPKINAFLDGFRLPGS